MSMVSEWILQIHRAVWFPVLYAMGLEGQSVEVMDRRFRYTAAESTKTATPTPKRKPPERKAV